MTSVGYYGKVQKIQSRYCILCVCLALSVSYLLHEVVFCNSSVAPSWLIVKDSTDVFQPFLKDPKRVNLRSKSIRLKRKRQKQQYVLLSVSVNSEQQIISESSPKYSVSMLKIWVSLLIVLPLHTLKKWTFLFSHPFSLPF